MATIVQFPGGNKPVVEKPAGAVDVYAAERHGMILLDGCVPATIMPALLALLNTAGVPVTQNAA